MSHRHRLNATLRGAVLWTVVAAVSAVTASAQEAVDTAALLKTGPVRSAVDAAKIGEGRTIQDQIRFCEVAAPPFQERARGELLKEAFVQLGLQNVRTDAAGNVIADRPGTAVRPRVVVAAHLDTVFPEETNVKVTRDGSILRGPGIGDNCRGLAVLVAMARSLKSADVQTPGTITFVANVGEEGLGDLRGVKQLFQDSLKGQVDRFVSIDGPGLEVTNAAVGSHRYRIAFKGPGGHSYGSFGMPNPISAMGRAIAKLADFQVPSDPRSTFNVGRVGGGTSINAIPFESWMEVDLRSADPRALRALDVRFQQAVDEAAAEENQRWGRPGTVTVVKQLVGDRPAGSTPADTAIVQTALAASRALGLAVGLGEGSTDANLPMSLRVPAITIGGGGRGSGAHALNESFDTTNAWTGTARAVLLTIALAQR